MKKIIVADLREKLVEIEALLERKKLDNCDVEYLMENVCLEMANVLDELKDNTDGCNGATIAMPF